ncbi:MAG: RNA polymerase subunit sigma [Cyclobacteriaceae bacterium]|nr:RNA polymerase subunit sigma [Cyclobacteriaceae bacterium]
MKMVGCVQEAEDIVQDSFLKYLTIEQEKIENTRAYLIRIVTNNCINHLKAFQKKNFEYFDHVNFPSVTEWMDFSEIDFDEEVADALALLHKKLEPLEKIIFLLREVFNVEYEELQKILNKKKDNCRQILCRAKIKLAESKEKFQMDVPSYEKLLQSFKNACSIGNPEIIVRSILNEHI